MARQARDGTLDLGSWCILRMASSDTLKVLRMLHTAGIEAWTPIEKRHRRMPRTRARFDKEFALLPSYVFGHVTDLDEMLRLAMVPIQGMPRFSLFQHNGGIPLIADDQLDALRNEESRVLRVFEKLKNRGRLAPEIGAGSEVRMAEGPFAGLAGVVESQSGQYTLVSFAGFHKPIQIASLLLASDMLSGEESSSDAATRKAA